MKRALGLLIIITAFLAGFLSIWGYIPVVPSFGSGMEPAIKSGSLITVKPVSVKEIKAGDIIVYRVPSLKREQYDYPAVVTHRVIEVKKGNSSLYFRTKGDNAGEDPFPVIPAYVKGTVGQEISYLGFPLFILKSRPGTTLVCLAILVIAVFLYSKELSTSSRRFYRKLINPVIQEYYNANLVLSHRFEATEAALDRFASSMERYSQYLDSHTSAIQGLSDASSELKKSAVEQTRVITHLLKTMEYKTYLEEISRMEGVFHGLERKAFEAEKNIDEPEELKIEDDVFPKAGVQSPSGCALKTIRY